jgi:CBS domain containing-hemolysin-like protein
MIILLLLNALFVAAEFSLVSVPRTTVDRYAAKGNSMAKVIGSILHDPHRQDQYLATSQLGITIASLGLGMYGEHAMTKGIEELFEISGLSVLVIGMAGIISSTLAVTVLSYFHIVLGETVPKSIGIRYPEKIVFILTPFMLAIKKLLYPLVFCLDVLTTGILNLIGIKRQVVISEHCHTTEELEFIIKESQEGGLLKKESGHVIEELFEFNELTAGEVMVPRVSIKGIEAGTDYKELAKLIKETPFTRYPVYKDDLDHIAGMIHIKDILKLLIKKSALTEEYIRPILYLPKTLHLDQIFAKMKKERIQMVIAMDEHGGTSGLVTIDDLFEEVVGQIEEKPEHNDIYLDVNGILHVSGTVRVEEVGEWLDLVLEHNDVDSVSGLVLTLLGRPPKVEDTVIYNKVKFQVTEIEGHGVKECIVIRE